MINRGTFHVLHTDVPPIANIGQGDNSTGFTAFPKRHRMHGNARDSPRSRMQNTLDFRRRRPRENITPRFRLLIDRIAYGVPNCRNLLPFVDKMRTLSLQGLVDFQLRQLAISKIIRRISNKKRTFRMNSACPCLTAPFGSLNANSTKCRQVKIQFLVNQSGTILINVHNLPFSANTAVSRRNHWMKMVRPDATGTAEQPMPTRFLLVP